jgi:hypothetical protein
VWECSNCGIKLPDQLAAVLGNEELASKLSKGEEGAGSASTATTAAGAAATGDVLEDRVYNMVIGFDQKLDSGISDVRGALDLVGMVGSLVGCGHWGFNRALYLHSGG